MDNIGTKDSRILKKEGKKKEEKQKRKEEKRNRGSRRSPKIRARVRDWHASKKGPHPHRPACVSQGSKFEQLYIGRKKSWSREKPVERERKREREREKEKRCVARKEEDE